MKTFFIKSRRNIVALFMSVLTAFCVLNPTTVFAAETAHTEFSPTETVQTDVIESSSTKSIQPRAGVETLPKGISYIGGFTFTNDNLTPVKTIAGSRVSFTVSFRKASIDAGLGNVKLKFQVRDIYGNALSPVYEQEANTDGSSAFLVTEYVELGYPGRQIQVWFDASSTGPSNGNYRSIEVYNWVSFIE